MAVHLHKLEIAGKMIKLKYDLHLLRPIVAFLPLISKKMRS